MLQKNLTSKVQALLDLYKMGFLNIFTTEGTVDWHQPSAALSKHDSS